MLLSTNKRGATILLIASALWFFPRLSFGQSGSRPSAEDFLNRLRDSVQRRQVDVILKLFEGQTPDTAKAKRLVSGDVSTSAAEATFVKIQSRGQNVVRALLQLS